MDDDTATGDSPSRLPPIIPPSSEAVDVNQRETLLAAGKEILECYRVLGRAGLNVVGEILRGQDDFVEFEHYPRDEVGDADNRSQYYYHAHRDPELEHGHFHTFIYTGQFASSMPLLDVPEGSASGGNDISHLIAISMDDWGYPIALFTTNQWVTGETWQPAETLIRQLPGFEIDHAYPSWPVNRWITAMVRFFRLHIIDLLLHRDNCIRIWQQTYPKQDVFEDRRLEVIGYLPISVHAWMDELQRSPGL